MSEDITTRSLDRRSSSSGRARGVALADRAAWQQGAWAGITKKSAMKPLKIGNLLTLSGPNAAPSIDVKRGFVAYVKPTANGIGGRKIQFFDADDANNPATAIQQVQKLVQEDQVDVIEGIFYSSVLLGVRDTIDQLQVPTVVANAAANALSRDRKSALHLPDLVLELPARRAARPLGQRRRSARAASSPRSPRTTPPARSRPRRSRPPTRRPAALSSGRSSRRSRSTPDYQPYFQQAADMGAKAVWAFTAGGGEAIKFVKTWRQFGFDKQFQLFGSNNMTDPQSVLDAEGDAALGIRTTANWAPALKNKENVLFLKQYAALGLGLPSAFAELGYVAAQFLDLALRKVHGDTSNKQRVSTRWRASAPGSRPAAS